MVRKAAFLCSLSSAGIPTDPWKERDDVVETECIAPQPHQPILTPNCELYKQLCTFYSSIETVTVD